MAKLDPVQGTTSMSVDFFVQDSSSTTGAGLTGLVYNSGSLTAYYYRQGAASATSMTLVTMTVGTWTSLGFKEIDATNMPGWYQLGIPNAALAAGAKSVKIMLKGATNMAPVNIELQLPAVDNQDAVRFGLSALPNGPMMFKKNQALSGFNGIVMRSSTDHITPTAGLTVTATRSIDRGAFASCTNSVSGVSGGVYGIDFSAADLNGNNIIFLFTATGADPLFVYAQTQP